jgi:hypothetical protein
MPQIEFGGCRGKAQGSRGLIARARSEVNAAPAAISRESGMLASRSKLLKSITFMILD